MSEKPQILDDSCSPSALVVRRNFPSVEEPLQALSDTDYASGVRTFDSFDDFAKHVFSGAAIDEEKMEDAKIAAYEMFRRESLTFVSEDERTDDGRIVRIAPPSDRPEPEISEESLEKVRMVLALDRTLERLGLSEKREVVRIAPPSDNPEPEIDEDSLAKARLIMSLGRSGDI